MKLEYIHFSTTLKAPLSLKKKNKKILEHTSAVSLGDSSPLQLVLDKKTIFMVP